jgi:hypothetical protein
VTEPPTADVVAAVAHAAGARPVAWTRVTGGGYTAAGRWLVDLDDGRRLFAKVGTTELVAGWLRTEHRAYREIAAPAMPRLEGWADGAVPVLLLEDLSDAHWPPPWDAGLVDRVLTTLETVAGLPCPAWAPPIEGMTHIFSSWSTVADDPGPFLGLGIVSARWLEAALPLLVANERPAELAGSALLHLDIRSDNVCFTSDRTVLVDWNLAARGNPLFDVAAWLPSLSFEGGPAPEEVSAEAGVFAAAMAGYLCARAPMPTIPDAPHVRRVQLEQASVALPWAARRLGLPAPDGPNA